MLDLVVPMDCVAYFAVLGIKYKITLILSRIYNQILRSHLNLDSYFLCHKINCVQIILRIKGSVFFKLGHKLNYSKCSFNYIQLNFPLNVY